MASLDLLLPSETDTTNVLDETDMDMEIACERLRSAGMRITRPRISTLKILLTSNQPLTVEGIHRAMPKHTCDLVTVYRCLGTFEAMGLIRRSFLYNGASIYELNRGAAITYNIICKKSQEVQSLNEAELAILRQAVKMVETSLVHRGYKNVSHSIEFFGIQFEYSESS